MSQTLLILKIYTTFKVKNIDISTGFRFSKISVECSVHLCSCPWTDLLVVFQIWLIWGEPNQENAWFSDLALLLFFSLKSWLSFNQFASKDLNCMKDSFAISTSCQWMSKGAFLHLAKAKVQIPKRKPNVEFFKNSYCNKIYLWLGTLVFMLFPKPICVITTINW